MAVAVAVLVAARLSDRGVSAGVRILLVAGPLLIARGRLVDFSHLLSSHSATLLVVFGGDLLLLGRAQGASARAALCRRVAGEQVRQLRRSLLPRPGSRMPLWLGARPL